MGDDGNSTPALKGNIETNEMPNHDERMRILTNMGVRIGKDTLNAEQAKHLSSLLYSYRDVMAMEMTDIPEMKT